MRKEFFRWWSITIMVLGVPIGIFMTGAGVWRFLGDVRLSARVFIVVWTACAASWTIFVTATPWLRKRSKTRPLLIIDDTGLWLRTVGELMPWSEIQSVDWVDLGRGGVQTIVVWRHERHPSHWGELMDHDGKHWWPHSIYKEIRERWERCRGASVSAESNQVAP